LAGQTSPPHQEIFRRSLPDIASRSLRRRGDVGLIGPYVWQARLRQFGCVSRATGRSLPDIAFRSFKRQGDVGPYTDLNSGITFTSSCPKMFLQTSPSRLKLREATSGRPDFVPSCHTVSRGMYHVYVIVPENVPGHYYIGSSSRTRERLQEHNAGKNPSTVADRPWRFAAVFGFPSEQRARLFERYLKGGSGSAFLRRHVLDG
jgi:putative endonuclease